MHSLIHCLEVKVDSAGKVIERLTPRSRKLPVEQHQEILDAASAHSRLGHAPEDSARHAIEGQWSSLRDELHSVYKQAGRELPAHRFEMDRIPLEASPAQTGTIGGEQRAITPGDLNTEKMLPIQSSTGGRGETLAAKVGAWHRDENVTLANEAGKILLDDNATNDKPQRVGIFQTPDGSVVAVSAWRTPRMASQGETRVASPAGGKPIGVRDLMAAGYKFIGSALSDKPLTKDYLHRWETRDSFEREFGEEADAIKANAESIAAPTEAKLAEKSTPPVFPAEPEPIHLEPAEVDTLIRHIPENTTVAELADMIGRADPGLQALFRKIASAADPDNPATASADFFVRVEEIGIRKALQEYGYETDAAKSGQVEPKPAGGAGHNLPNVEQRVAEQPGGPPPAVEGEKDRAGQPQPPGVEGNAVANQTRRVSRDEVLGQLAGMLGLKEKRHVEAMLDDPDSEHAVRVALQEHFNPQHWQNLAQEASRSAEEAYNDALKRGTDFLDQAKRALGIETKGTEPPLKHSLTEAQPAEAYDPVHEQRIRAAQDNLAKVGITLTLKDAGDLIAKNAVTDPVTGKILQLVGDVLGAQDVARSYEETGHLVFHRETPEARERLLAAIRSVSNNELGISLEDPRLAGKPLSEKLKQTKAALISEAGRASKPLSEPGFQEERLMKVVAQGMVREGFDPSAAGGYAQSFVRTLKDLYYRAALAVQKILGMEPSPELALRYFENRVKRLLAGDTSAQSYMEWLGLGTPQPGDRHQWWFESDQRTAARVGLDGIPEYDHLPDLTAEAMRLNDDNALRFNLTDVNNPAKTRTTETEDRAATYNHIIGIYDAIGKATQKIAGVDKQIEESKRSPAEYVRKLFGRLDDPNGPKAELKSRVEPDGTPVKYNPDIQLSELDNPDRIIRKLSITAQAMRTRIANVMTGAESDLERQTKAAETARENFEEKKFDYKDRHAQQTTVMRHSLVREMGRLFNSIAGLSERSGYIEAQLKALDPTAVLKDYARVFEKLWLGRTEIEGKVFDLLDKAARDKTIDFSAPAYAIRDAMKAAGGYEPLIAGGRESNALLATAIALAKANSRMMEQLERRRMKDGTARAAIEEKLKAEKAGAGKLGTNLRELTREATLEERARIHHFIAKGRLADAERALDQTRTKIKVAKAALPVVDKAINALASKTLASADVVVKDGAEFYDPFPGMSTDAVKATRFKLVLDPNTGEVTSPDKLRAKLLNWREWLNEQEKKAGGDESALGQDYQFVKRSFYELAAKSDFNPDRKATDRFLWELNFMAPFKAIKDAFPGPIAELLGRMGYSYGQFLGFLNNLGAGVSAGALRHENKLLSLLPKDVSRARLRELIVDPVKTMWERDMNDLSELYRGDEAKKVNAAYARIREQLLKNDVIRELIGRDTDKFMSGLRDLVEFEHEKGGNYTKMLDEGRQIYDPTTGKNLPAPVGVKDEGLKVIHPITGELVPAIRRFLKSGERMFPRRMSAAFGMMAHALRQSNWAAFRDVIGEGKLAEAYTKSPDEARALVNKFLTNPKYGATIRNSFLRALAEMPEDSKFDAPVMKDGITRPPADPLKVKAALDAAGDHDLIGFAENLYKLHGGEMGLPEYVQQVAEQLAGHYDEAERIASKSHPVSPGKNVDLNEVRGMFHDALIDSRTVENLPGSWFSFHNFDGDSIHRMNRSIAAEMSMGRDAEHAASLFEQLENQVKAGVDELRAAREEVKAGHPTMPDNRIEKLVRQNLGADYKRLKQMEERAPLIRKTMRGLSTYFRQGNSIDGSLRMMTRVAQLLGVQLVNNPASAIYQDAQLFDPIFRYGVSPSTLAFSREAIKQSLHETVGSLAQTVGIEIRHSGEYRELYDELRLSDPVAFQQLRDHFDKWENESGMGFAVREAAELTNVGANLLGDRAPFTVFRPMGVFNWRAIIGDKSLTLGMWKFSSLFVMRGMKFFRSHPDILADPNYRLTDTDLGISKIPGESQAFARLREDMQGYGLNFDQMVRGNLKRGDGKLMTDGDAMRLHALSNSLISSKGGLDTMFTSAYNNSILRFMIPLLGWSMRRSLDLTGKRLDAQGRLSASAMAQGVAGLAAVSVGGMALSALVDQYYEELLGKKRNLRPILSAGGFIEHSARLGQTGLFGELANGVMNVGTGGDQRILSLDRRVVALSAFQTVQNAITSAVNMGEVDYAHVGRPLLAAMGGNAALQYMDMANNAFGLDNAEARVTRRMNAQNYLRVVGRELNLEVRPQGGSGFTSPTPLSPYLTRMELAAYADNAADFMENYRAAIAQAQADGDPDPVGSVKSKFAGRNPLRNVFRTSPTEAEYRRILAALPEGGREDVVQAVGFFNKYVEQIGGHPFEGKTEKAKTVTATPTFGQQRQRQTNILNMRQKAVEAMYR